MPIDPKQDAQLAQVQLELKRAESQNRLLRLKCQLSAHEEQRASLARQLGSLVDSLGRAKKENQAATAELQAALKTASEQQARAAELEKEVGVLQRRRADKQERDQELSRQIERAQAEAAALRKELSLANDELHAGCNALVRVKKKFSKKP
jgi:chromosome segregation ATPase